MHKYTDVVYNRVAAKVVGGSASGALKLWDLATGKLVRSLSGHKSNIRSIDFHPYGEFIASGSFDTNLKVPSVLKQTYMYSLLQHHTNEIY